MMIDIVFKNLSDYLVMLQKHENFSLSRYWDGELASIMGREGKNCDSCAYTPELKAALRETLITNKPYYHCLYFPEWKGGTKNLQRSFAEYLHEIHCKVVWYDAMVFQAAFCQGSFFDVIKTLSKRNIIFVGGEHLLRVSELMRIKSFLPIPRQNAFEQIDDICEKIADHVKLIEKPVVVLCAGMASNCIIDRLYGIDATMIDMGSVWDACLKLNSRIWMRKIPEQVIRRNLNA
jgi:hypothetical protein